jgi:hypothetical protein
MRHSLPVQLDVMASPKVAVSRGGETGTYCEYSYVLDGKHGQRGTRPQ